MYNLSYENDIGLQGDERARNMKGMYKAVELVFKQRLKQLSYKVS